VGATVERVDGAKGAEEGGFWNEGGEGRRGGTEERGE
jgi:hypothetical protein